MLGYTATVLQTRKVEVARIMHSIATDRHQVALTKPIYVGTKRPVAPAPLTEEAKSAKVAEAKKVATESAPRAAKKSTPKASVPEVSASANGVWATHAKFGKGLIISESDGKITVAFEDGVTRTLITALAGLVR